MTTLGRIARKRFLVTEKVATGKNAHGETLYAWKTKYYLQGTLEYTGAKESATGGVQQQAIGTHRLISHYRKEGRPTPENRLISQDITYEIVSVGDLNGDGKAMVLTLKQLQ